MNTERQYMTDFKHPNDENRTIAMAYVPWQQFRNLYDLEQALQVGTIFAELDKPFTGRGGMYRENCMLCRKTTSDECHLSVWLRHQ